MALKREGHEAGATESDEGKVSVVGSGHQTTAVTGSADMSHMPVPDEVMHQYGCSRAMP